MIGTLLGHYEIVGKLGEGGMGVVYLARDSHLDRTVAIKVLKPDKVTDATRRQRFIQEARAASALNHPNIVGVHDITSEDGVIYMVMEYVPGRTLDAFVHRRGMRVPEALTYAVQIANALATAHAAGIIHRDVKPANVLVTDRGVVKVLDFGLAKLHEETGSSDDEKTKTVQTTTAEGTVLGSASYMSPEQAEGKKVDARSDIFSFGAVLYEMLTGQRAFQGESRMSVLAGVIGREPLPIGQLAPSVPRELERIVFRCLRKDVNRRSQSMAEIALALEELKQDTESGATAQGLKADAARRRWRRVAVAAALLAGAGLFWTARVYRAAREPPAVEMPIATRPGLESEPSLSPDGNQVAFSWDGDAQNAPAQIYISLLGKGSPLKLTSEPVRADYPAWSPDGQSIAYFRFLEHDMVEIAIVPALGGQARIIGRDFAHAHLSWFADSKWLCVSAAAGRQSRGTVLEAVSVETGERRAITAVTFPGSEDIDCAVSPDGTKVAFIRIAGQNVHDLYVAPMTRDHMPGGQPRRLTTDRTTKGAPGWTSDGHYIYFVTGDLTSDRRIKYVAASGGTVRVASFGVSAVCLTTARKANRLVYSKSLSDVNIWRLSLDGKQPDAVDRRLSSSRFECSPAWSPDGRQVAFSSNRSGIRQIWLADADGSNITALTSFTDGSAGSPRWSPDGQAIAFAARPGGNVDVYTVRADGTGLRRLTTDPAEDNMPCWSPDGRWIVFTSNRTGRRQIHRMPANGGDAVQVTRNGGHVPLVSPDSKWIYYDRAVGTRALWKVPFEGGEEIEVVRDLSPYAFAMTPRGLYYAVLSPPPAPHSLHFLSWSTGKAREVRKLPARPYMHISVSPDEQSLMTGILDLQNVDLVMVDNFR